MGLGKIVGILASFRTWLSNSHGIHSCSPVASSPPRPSPVPSSNGRKMWFREHWGPTSTGTNMMVGQPRHAYGRKLKLIECMNRRIKPLCTIRRKRLGGSRMASSPDVGELQRSLGGKSTHNQPKLRPVVQSTQQLGPGDAGLERRDQLHRPREPCRPPVHSSSCYARNERMCSGSDQREPRWD